MACSLNLLSVAECCVQRVFTTQNNVRGDFRSSHHYINICMTTDVWIYLKCMQCANMMEKSIQQIINVKLALW